MSVIEDFKWRGVASQSSEGLEEHLNSQPIKAYVGFDPTASSLHVGSLLPVMNLVRLQRAGHTPIAIVGGGTGMIGDPSGKTIERQLLTRAQIDENCDGIRAQLAHFLDFEVKSNAALLINNADWLAPISMLDFLRDVGKHFTVNYMLAKESVRRRLDSDTGISFTEFSYMLLQAYDYLVLYQRLGCTLQMGGSDQWGNIVAGMELIRRVEGGSAHALVFPLVTTSSGVKFGKTEAGTVWLDPARTSPFRFYQFWLQTDDRDVIPYLRSFTLLERSEIEELEAAMTAAPEKREPQQRLAAEVTRKLHGEDALARAQAASRVLFGGSIGELTAAEVAEIFSDVPSTEIPRSEFAGEGKPFADLTTQTGLTSSKADARRLIEGGGLYLNNERVPEPRFNVTLEHMIEGQYAVLRKGAREYHLVRLVG